MAKLFGSAKAAFLRLMASGRSKSRRKKSGGGKRRAKGRRRGRTAAQKAATRKLIAANRRRGKHGKKRHGKKSHRAKSRRKNPGVEALLVNPSGGSKKMAKKRRHGKKHRKSSRGRRRHRNPMSSIKGLGGQAMRIGVPAVVAGGVAGFVESKFLGGRSPFVRGIARVVMGVAGAALTQKITKNQIAAAAAGGAIIGGIGNEQGIKLGGGLVLSSKTAGMKELAEAMSADDDMGLAFREEMHGLGTVVEMRELGDGEGEGTAGADVDGLAEDDAA